jgi:hypothetical protein
MTPKVRLTRNFSLDSFVNTNKLAFCDKKSEKIFKERNVNTYTKKIQ